MHRQRCSWCGGHGSCTDAFLERHQREIDLFGLVHSSLRVVLGISSTFGTCEVDHVEAPLGRGSSLASTTMQKSEPKLVVRAHVAKKVIVVHLLAN